MKVTLHVWRQSRPSTAQDPRQDGRLERHELDGASPDMSFLELLDVLNERLIRQGRNDALLGRRLVGRAGRGQSFALVLCRLGGEHAGGQRQQRRANDDES